MSYINQDTLQAFVSDSSFLTKDAEPAGLGEAIAQADAIIFQKTRITIPEDPTETNAMIRNIACALVVWFTSGMQGKLDEHELSRRKKQYDDAMAQLDSIASGRESIVDSAGTVVSTQPQTYFSSTQRLGSAL